MTISVNWSTDQVISINKVDMVLVQSTPVEVYQLNANTLFTALKDLEATQEGMPWTDTQRNNSPVTLGGITYARILEIIEPYTITFEDDQYAVDVVGANTNILDRTNPNQVSVRSNNSAGLVGTRELQNLSFEDSRIWINTFTGQAGTTFPIGTPAAPVSNFADADQIETERNLPPRFSLFGTLSLTTGTLTFHDFLGAGADVSVISIGSGIDTTGLVVEQVTLSGDISGPISARNSRFGTITGFSGSLNGVSLGGNVTVDAANTNLVSLRDSHSSIPGTGRPILDVNGANCDVILDNYSGGIEIRNFNQGNSMTINASACSVRIHPSCTSGVIKIRGDFALENNASGNVGLTVLTYENDESSKWERLEKIHTRLGMNPNNPITDTPTGIDSANGDIDINRTGDGTTSSTLTRQ